MGPKRLFALDHSAEFPREGGKFGKNYWDHVDTAWNRLPEDGKKNIHRSIQGIDVESSGGQKVAEDFV
jgi:hypothetical protein